MNLSSLTYRHKLIGAALGFVLLLVIGWKVTISETIDLSTRCESLRSELGRTQNAPEQLALKTLQLEHLEKLIGKNDLHPDMVQQSILDAIDGFGEKSGPNIYEVLPIHSASDEEFEVITHMVTVDGKFNELAALGFELENRFSEARLVSIKYIKEKDRRSKRNRLLATYYLQNIRKL
jgi:hypothetical protein